jgi:hypothetical protein
MMRILFCKGVPGAMTKMAGLVSEQKADVNREITKIMCKMVQAVEGINGSYPYAMKKRKFCS